MFHQYIKIIELTTSLNIPGMHSLMYHKMNAVQNKIDECIENGGINLIYSEKLFYNNNFSEYIYMHKNFLIEHSIHLSNQKDYQNS
jgi:hypothetical protein